MLYYWAFLKIIYDLPVRQIVFYISDTPLTMVNHYESENFVHSIQERLVREGRLSLIKRNGKLFRRKL